MKLMGQDSIDTTPHFYVGDDNENVTKAISDSRFDNGVNKNMTRNLDCRPDRKLRIKRESLF